MFESMIFRMWYWIWFGFSQTSSLLGLYSVCRMFACRQVVIEFIRFLHYFTIYALNWSQEESYDSPTLHTPLCIGEVKWAMIVPLFIRPCALVKWAMIVLLFTRPCALVKWAMIVPLFIRPCALVKRAMIVPLFIRPCALVKWAMIVPLFTRRCALVKWAMIVPLFTRPCALVKKAKGVYRGGHGGQCPS